MKWLAIVLVVVLFTGTGFAHTGDDLSIEEQTDREALQRHHEQMHGTPLSGFMGIGMIWITIVYILFALGVIFLVFLLIGKIEGDGHVRIQKKSRKKVRRRR